MFGKTGEEGEFAFLRIQLMRCRSRSAQKEETSFPPSFLSSPSGPPPKKSQEFLPLSKMGGKKGERRMGEATFKWEQEEEEEVRVGGRE